MWGECVRCHEFGFNVEKCPCKPFPYWVSEEDAGADDFENTQWAKDIEQALDKIAESWFGYDFDGWELDVWIRPIDDSDVQHYKITVEPVPYFHAELVNDGPSAE